MNGLQERKEPSVPNGFEQRGLDVLWTLLEETGKKCFAVEIGITCNLTVMCLPLTQRLHGLLVTMCLIWSVKNILHYAISISRKSREWDCIVRMTRMANTFQTDSMLMCVFRRRNTTPGISQIYRMYMSGWSIFLMFKSSQCRMLIRLLSNDKKNMQMLIAIFTSIKYRNNWRRIKN